MLTPEENDLLCRVVGQAPMGQLMRRHWTPVCLFEEVPEPDGTPVRARLFGEDLVVFRDTNGAVGVMDEYCPHRRASLVLGRNENCGLRCLYHGWKMDVHGNVLEMVSEPAASGMAHKVKHLAYPTEEWGGFVWAYMGPPETRPQFAPPPWAPTAATRVTIAKVVIPCNWAQILEGAIDSAHSSSLHSSDMVPARVDGAKATASNWLRPSTDKAPRLQVERGPLWRCGRDKSLRGLPTPDALRRYAGKFHECNASFQLCVCELSGLQLASEHTLQSSQTFLGLIAGKRNHCPKLAREVIGFAFKIAWVLREQHDD